MPAWSIFDAMAPTMTIWQRSQRRTTGTGTAERCAYIQRETPLSVSHISAKNPYSQFRDIYTLDQIKESRTIYGPLTMLQCCPTSDGAGCAIVASEEFVRKHGLLDQAVEICAQVMATDSPHMLSTDGMCNIALWGNILTICTAAIEWSGADMTRRAAKSAYQQAGITADDVQVVELHDCFSANEVTSQI